MATLMQPKTEKEIRRLGVANVRDAYLKLAKDYNHIIDGDYYYCHMCNKFLSKDAFYNDNRYASGLYPECKQCLKMQATDYDRVTKEFSDNREKTIEVFHKMDLPFIDALYKDQVQKISENIGEKTRSLAYLQMLVIVKSLDQYKNLRWKDSDFGEGEMADVVNLSTRKPRKEIIKLFGAGFTNDDYLYLQDQYDDWCARTQVDSKSQQTYVVQISLTLLDIYKDRKAGRDVTNKLKALDTLMNAANLQPKQNVSNAATDSLTFGQLIERWEEEEPIPEPDPELADVDNIQKNLRVWFGGWLAHALGLNIPLSKEYEDEVAKYSVEAPEVTEVQSSSAVYKELFGGATDE